MSTLRSIAGTLFVVLLVLKLTGVVNITWLGVFSPILIAAAFAVVSFLAMAALGWAGYSWLSKR